MRSRRYTDAMSTVETVFGVDFSGARLAGRFIWIAQVDVRPPRPLLVSLNRLDRLCGTAERQPALAHLVAAVRDSEHALWALDFPFGFPLEVPGGPWAQQFDFLDQFGDDAYAAGLACVARARELGLPLHVRRTTDVEARTPFDCYHYRIIYQAFFGMRDVLRPLRADRHTAILPFQYVKLRTATRIVVEACPSSTLKRLGLPHHTYKQPAGGPLTTPRRRTRQRLLAALAALVDIEPGHRLVMMRDPGGDALDAVWAAVGGWDSYTRSDPVAIRRHPRYRLEGRLFF